MKHSRLIITALLALTGLCASAADLTEQYHATFDTSQYPSGRLLAQDSGYMPLVVEGRRWDYEDNGKEFSYIIRGDTVIGGKSYKKVYQVWDDGNDSHYFASLRESDRRVYAVRDSQTQEEMLYDFALSLKLDEIEYDETHIYRTLITTGTRCTDGNLHRNTLFSIFNTASIYETSTAYLWVEGVGAPFYQLFSPTGFRTGDEVCVFLACYQGDNCIYEYNDISISPEIVGWPLPCKPLLRQGRRWNYRYCAADVSQQVDVRQWLEGDTTVAGNKYMKLYEVRGDEGAHVRGLLREDSCYIYWYDQEANTERLLMKQGMGQYEQTELCIPAAAQENCRMVLARNIGSADHTYRRQGFETSSGDTSLWVEGIGFEDCGLSFGTDHASYELLSVYDGDECIYGMEIEDEYPAEPQELTAEDYQLLYNSNGFAFDLFSKAREGSSMVLSPLSVTYALSLLNNGADGQTRQEISSTLGFGDAGMDAVNAFCRKMLTRSGQLDSLTQVETASAVFVNRPFTLLPAFRQTAEQYYDAAAESLDFADSQSLGIINQWADDHTHGMIPRVLGMLDPGIVSYLLNAVYFKGTWTQKFDPAETRREPFGGNGEKVWMMHLLDNMYYDENETFQVLQLPYGNRSYTMTVLLPREGKDIADVLGQIDGRQWQRSFSIRREMVDVKLPRMDVTSDVQLDGVLQSLGMQRAFDQWAAEFPYFCDTETYVGRVSQKARLRLDEEGTEASAVTVVITPPGGEEHTPQTYEFHADRPFLYVISEQATGAVYFIGQYMGKTSSQGPEGDLVTPSTHWQFKDAELGNASEQIAVFNDRKQEAVLKQEAVAPGYGLQGRRVQGTPQRGLYIREGRKVIK